MTTITQPTIEGANGRTLPSQTTKEAYQKIQAKGIFEKEDIKLGEEDKTWEKTPNFTTKVKAWTQEDNQTHKYFHSLSIDVQVQDFTGTAELKCPYDSDLIEYWEPIRQTVVIYGTNKGKYKILFVGRVREVKQDGYELVITFQNYGWKFQQNASTSFVEDNVKSKDGYTIMKLIFEALKIDSYYISKSAKERLKEVGINDEGNLTLNGSEVEEMPDLLDRLQDVDMSDIVSNQMISNKYKEEKLANIKNINYTLKYEEPTEVMSNIQSESQFSPGSTVYSNPYSGTLNAGASVVAAAAAKGDNRTTKEINVDVKKNIYDNCTGAWRKSSLMSWMSNVYKVYHGGLAADAKMASEAKKNIRAYIKRYPTEKGHVTNCVNTIKNGATNNKSWNAY